jgi:hypothetical protein
MVTEVTHLRAKSFSTTLVEDVQKWHFTCCMTKKFQLDQPKARWKEAVPGTRHGAQGGANGWYGAFFAVLNLENLWKTLEN